MNCELNSVNSNPVGLKPCPLCGSGDIVLFHDHGGIWYITCSKCGFHVLGDPAVKCDDEHDNTPPERGKDEVVNKWNRSGPK